MRHGLWVVILAAAASLGAGGLHFGILQSVNESLDEFKAQITPMVTATRGPSPTPLPTFTRTCSYTPSPTASPTFTASPSLTVSPSFTASPTSSASPTASPTGSPAPTRTATRSATATRTPLPTKTATRTPSPTITPTVPPSQGVWNSCAGGGAWFGHSLGNLNLFDGVLASCDAIGSGAGVDPFCANTPSALVVNPFANTGCNSAGSSYGMGVYAPGGDSNASGYRANGHLTFDLELGTDAVSALVVSIGDGYPSSNIASVSLNPGDYSSTAFTQVSVPISSFSPDVTPSMNMPFFLTAVVVSAPANNDQLFYVNNVTWTPN